MANTSWLMMERVLRIVIVLAVNVSMARYLGSEGFGTLSYAISIASMFFILANLGLNDVLVKELRANPDRKNVILGSGLLLICLGSAIAWSAICAISFLLDDRLSGGLVLIVSLAVIFRTSSILESYFQANVLGKYASVAGIVQLFVSAAVKIAFIWHHAPISWFAWAVVLDYALLFLTFMVAFFLAGNSWVGWRFESPQVKWLLRSSWPLLLSGVFVTVYMKIDQIMIMHFLNAQAVGYYSVAVQLSEAWYFVPVLISASLFPSILDARAKGEIYYKRLGALYRLMCAIGLVAAIVATLFSELAIGFLFGAEFIPAVPALQIHIWAGIFVGLGVSSGKWFVAENLNRHLFYRTFCGSVINVLLNLQFIPYWGIQGAALATLLSHGFAAFIYDAFNPVTRATFFMKVKALICPIPIGIRT